MVNARWKGKAVVVVGKSRWIAVEFDGQLAVFSDGQLAVFSVPYALRNEVPTEDEASLMEVQSFVHTRNHQHLTG